MTEPEGCEREQQRPALDNVRSYVAMNIRRPALGTQTEHKAVVTKENVGKPPD